jgi:hypothetical protein
MGSASSEFDLPSSDEIRSRKRANEDHSVALATIGQEGLTEVRRLMQQYAVRCRELGTKPKRVTVSVPRILVDGWKSKTIRCFSVDNHGRQYLVDDHDGDLYSGTDDWPGTILHVSSLDPRAFSIHADITSHSF